MMMDRSFRAAYLAFTFQYGSIQMRKYPWCNQRYRTLHSNMVLFKLCLGQHRRASSQLYIPIWLYSNRISVLIYDSVCRLYIPIWFYSNASNGLWNGGRVPYFTFQSGYIQIKIITKLSDPDALFTFQSGYIQIRQSMTLII